MNVAINTDGSLVAVAGGPTGDVAVYRTADAQAVGTVPGRGRPDGVDLVRDTAALDFGPDSRLYLGSMLGPIDVIDPATLTVTKSIPVTRHASPAWVTSAYTQPARSTPRSSGSVTTRK